MPNSHGNILFRMIDLAEKLPTTPLTKEMMKRVKSPEILRIVPTLFVENRDERIGHPAVVQGDANRRSFDFVSFPTPTRKNRACRGPQFGHSAQDDK